MITALVTDPDAALARINPVAKITAVALITAGLVATVDPLTATVLLAVELLALPATGVGVGTLLRRSWPLGIAVGGVALANLIVVDGGRTVLALGPFEIGSHAVQSAAAVALRLIAITLPGILVLAATDPMDLADALVQRWHLPARFAYGALAALRLLPLLSADWALIGLARRARGLEAGRNPVARLRLFGSQTFAVLVAAIRRGVRLAAAMEARGFDASSKRSIARPQPMRPVDWSLIVGTGIVVLLATALSVQLGIWSPALGG